MDGGGLEGVDVQVLLGEEDRRGRGGLRLVERGFLAAVGGVGAGGVKEVFDLFGGVHAFEVLGEEVLRLKMERLGGAVWVGMWEGDSAAAQAPSAQLGFDVALPLVLLGERGFAASKAEDAVERAEGCVASLS